MWWEDPKYNDEGGTFSDYLKQLIDMGHLEGAALGITEKVISEGVNSLSEKQKHAFKNYVIDPFTLDECKCGIKIDWTEMDAAIEYGACGECIYKESRKDKF